MCSCVYFSNPKPNLNPNLTTFLLFLFIYAIVGGFFGFTVHILHSGNNNSLFFYFEQHHNIEKSSFNKIDVYINICLYVLYVQNSCPFLLNIRIYKNEKVFLDIIQEEKNSFPHPLFGTF